MRELFEREYKKIEKALFLTAISYLHNTEDAKDALQEAAISAYQGFGRLKNIEYFKTWMTRIVINKSIDIGRKQKYTVELTDNINVFYDMSESDMEILDAICSLGSELSVYISLRFYNGMTYEEAAKVLRLPVSTVKYRTKKAIKKLKNILEGDE